jgi:hypothetical protein
MQRLGKDPESLVIVRAIGLTLNRKTNAPVCKTMDAPKDKDICSARRFLQPRSPLFLVARPELRGRPRERSGFERKVGIDWQHTGVFGDEQFTQIQRVGDCLFAPD